MAIHAIEIERNEVVSLLWRAIEMTAEQVTALRAHRMAGRVTDREFAVSWYSLEGELAVLYERLIVIDPLSAKMVGPAYDSIVARRGLA